VSPLAPDDPRRLASAHCFVDDLDHPELTSGDRHHLARVLRLRPGEPMTITDGEGSWRSARFDGRDVVPDGAIRFDVRPAPEITVGFSVLKGDRSELVTQKLCELGVDVIVPFRSERSIPRWDDERAAANHERLERVAREAAMQSRRVWRPRVEPVRAIGDVLAGGDYALADPAGPPITLADRRVLVGPEGGWGDTERAAAPSFVGLGPGLLRAETAAITAGALLTALRDGILREAG
jgi:16S rRNA (uracil1498-N3)-methyltransferase